MKKIIYAVLATLSGLVLIFSYRTSLDAVQPMAVTDPAGSIGTAPAVPTTPTTTGDESESDGESEADDESESDDDSGSSTASGTSSGTSSSSGSTSSSGSGSSSTTTASGLTDGTYTGGAANTRYGPVQVQITVSGGQIADVQVVDYPHSNSRDQQINQNALPRLISETLQAQSSQIHMVSGATYTSRGYASSLQSAIDQA